MSCTHMGPPPNEWESWESHTVHIHHFESLPCEKGRLASSQRFSCFGHEWRLEIYPGGRKDSSCESDPGMVALYLKHCSGPEVSAKAGFFIRGPRGKIVLSKELITERVFEAAGNNVPAGGTELGWGWKDFIKRSDVIDPSKNVLKHGTLTVEVRIKPEDDHCNLNFIPKNALAKNIGRSFLDKSTADITFEVKGEDETSANVMFPAHKFVMRYCAEGSTLASLCEDYNESKPVLVSDVSPGIFNQMLFYVYGGSIAVDEWEDKSKDLLEAADRFGLKDMKIEAEAWYVKHLQLTVDNVIENLLYADQKNCFLLKEKATEYVLENVNEVLESESFENVLDSKNVMRELFSLVAINKESGGKKDLEDPKKLSINELRAKLYDKGKEIDGPRKRLIADLMGPEKKKVKS